MSNCNIDHSDYKNNGLITKIWGNAGWTFNHSVTFGYPLEPTPEQKMQYKNYFTSLGDVLPCKYCRESYKNFITTGKTALTDAALENRESLTRWFYDVHEAVNDKLEIDYGITYQDMVDKYESFRARCGKPEKTAKGCVAPLDYKAFSFKKLYYTDAPIVSLKIIEPFVRLAKLRGLDNKFFEYVYLAREFNGNFDALKKHPTWIDRNKICQYIIKYMRENAIQSIEDENSDWRGTPSLQELALLMFLSSNLNRTELGKALNALYSIEKSKLI